MNVEMTVTRKVADMDSGSTSRDALPSPTVPCSGNEFFQVVCDCIIPVNPYVKELKRKLLLVILLLSWSCLGLTTLREDIFRFFILAVPASHTTWMQQCSRILHISVHALVAVGVWINIFQRLAAEVAPQSGCGDGARRQVCPELVDQHAQTGQVVEKPAQTICKCLVLEDECDGRLSERQQTEKSVLSAAVMRYQSEGEHDAERVDGLRADDGMTAESRLESPVDQPRRQTSSSSSSSTQTSETSSVLEDAKPRDDINAITQDPATDPPCRLPKDESCSSQNDIEGNVVSSEHSPKEVHVYVDRKQQRGKVSLDFMKTSLQLAQFTEQKNPEHVKLEVEELQHKLAALVGEWEGGKSSGKASLMKELMAMRFTGQRQEQVFTYQKGLEGGGVHEELWREGNRLATFSMYSLVPESGVWLMRLAEAGFYCPDKHSTVLRCAFCGVKVEIGHFRNRAPWEVHRTMSPCCPLVKGESQNQSMEEQTRTVNRQYTKMLASRADVDPRAASHGGAEHNPSPDSGRQKAPEGAASLSDRPPSTHLNCSGGCDSQPQAQRHGSASATQSVPHQPGAAGSRQASGSSGVPFSTNLPGGAQFNPSAASSISTTSPAACPSTGAGRGNTAGESVTPGGSTERTGSGVGDPAPRREQPRQAEGQVSSGVSGGAPSSSRSGATENSGSSQTSQPSCSAGSTRNPSDPQPHQTVSTSSTTVYPGNPQPFQTARVVEGSQERTDPGATSHTAAAAAPAPPATTTTAATTTASSPPSSSSTTANEEVRQVVTYAQLGIYTQEPKRPDMAIASARARTYSDWPLPDSHPPEHMAEAGFYYVGIDDLVRCFYCKGGLKSWSTSLKPWVEHARFYPKCPFVGQVKGQEFIEAVQHLKEKQRDISEADVEEELQKRQSGVLGKGSASEDGAVAAEGRMKGSDGGAKGAMQKERTAGVAAMADDENGGQADDTHLQKIADDLETANLEIKNERMCKICQVNDVSILFLPCGHLVSCSHCAPALRTCAVCRQRVKGRVRVSDHSDFKEVETDTEMASPADDLLIKG